MKDGIHTGGPNDPRMILIKVKTNTIHYFIKEQGQSTAGEFVDIVKGALVGNIPKLGKIRQLSEKDIDAARTLEE